MSRGFVKEGDQEEVPMVLPRAFLPSGVPNYVTPEGLKLLHEEMENLKAEWTEAGLNYMTKNYIDAKMRLLSKRINTAVLIDPAKTNPDVVSFGMYVKYNDNVIRIVGVDEADSSKGLISFISPIAKALIGKKKGDKFEIKVPKGTETIEIKEVDAYRIHPIVGTHRTRSEIKSQPIRSNVEQQEIKSQPTPLYIQSTEIKSQPTPNISEFKPKVDITEFLPIINERANIIGRALYCEIHNGNKLLHPAVHLIVYNSKKEIAGKYWWHVAFGETVDKMLKDKVKNIIPATDISESVSPIKPKFKKQYIRDVKNEKELVSVFTAVYDGDVLPTPQSREWEDIFEKSMQ